MAESRYWQTLTHRRLQRRDLLRSGASDVGAILYKLDPSITIRRH